MKKLISHAGIMKTLDWAYERALSGIPGLETAPEMAAKYMMQEGTLNEKVNSLIRWQNAKAGTSGFLTGAGGWATMAVLIPANLASVLFIQVRMIAAIAHMAGYNLRDEKVKSLVLMCLAGNVAKDILQEAGIMIGKRFTVQVLELISEKSLLAINQKVGFRLLSTYSSKGMISVSKAVPLVGGVIGGGIDVFTTNLIGNAARHMFIDSPE